MSLTNSIPQLSDPSIGARIIFRHTASYVAPRLIAATILAVRDCGGETHVEIQPDDLPFARFIHRNEIRSYLWTDPECDEFDAAREVEHYARMEAREHALQAAARLRESTAKDVAARERRERLDANTEPERWVHAPFGLLIGGAE